jgi:hypothetical protein
VDALRDRRLDVGIALLADAGFKVRRDVRGLQAWPSHIVTRVTWVPVPVVPRA